MEKYDGRRKGEALEADSYGHAPLGDYEYKGTEGYCYPGTDVLKNKLNIRDDEKLTNAEREITSIKLLMLYKSPIIKELNFEHYCNIHKTLFEDIYEWAGLIRKGEFLSKGNPIFCKGSLIKENVKIIFGNIKKENYLKGLDKNKYVERMAYYIGEINALHPFREGNGRTSREYFRQLSLNADYVLDYSKTIKEELLKADINAFNGHYEDLIKILEKAIVKHGTHIQ